MSITAYAGPLVAFGQAPYGDYNSDRGPSSFDQGTMLLDPRQIYGYAPGQRGSQPTYGWATWAMIPVINQVPSTISAVNIAAAQVPVAGTALTLVSSSGAGITVSTSITNALTGAAVTGLLAIDTAMSGVVFGTGGDGSGGSQRIWDPTKSIARNVRITTVADETNATFTVRGYDLYSYPVTETITGVNNSVASGKKAFKYITSVTPAGTLSGSNVSVGTGDVIGLPLRADNYGEVLISWNSAIPTASTGFVAAVTTSPATATTGDVRGTYALQSASDNTKRLAVWASPNATNIQSIAGLLGVTQYSG